MNETLKNRKKPTEHRQGTLIKLVDAIQELIELRYGEKLYINIDKEGDDLIPNPEVFDKILEVTKELRCFDITTIGNLYLTSGGRVVLDKGYGEYFNEGDKTIFTLDELKSGIEYNKFKKRLLDTKGDTND